MLLLKAMIFFVAISTAAIAKDNTGSTMPVEHFKTAQGLSRTGDVIWFWMRVTPNKGWKFNDKYPTRYKVNKVDGYRLINAEIRKEKDSKTNKATDNRVIRLTIIKGSSSKQMRVTVRFGICNKVTCKIYRKVVTLNVP